MCTRLLRRLLAAGQAAAQALRRRLAAITRSATAPLLVGTLADLARTKPELLAENALLRQQLLILRRHASRLRTWRQALLIIQPETVLRWHRRLFRWPWRRKCQAQAPAHRPPLAPETIALTREMAAAHRPWGAERIRGQL